MKIVILYKKPTKKVAKLEGNKKTGSNGKSEIFDVEKKKSLKKNETGE